MKKFSVVLILFLFALLIFASDNMLSKIFISDKNLNLTQHDTTINGADFVGKLDELLTLQMAAEISGFDASKAVIEYDNKASIVFGGEKKPPRECIYLWDNGRTRVLSMGGNTVNTPYKDRVAIHSVSNTTLERFKRNYGALSAEQKRKAVKKIEEESDKGNNTTANQKMRQEGTNLVMNLQVEEITNVGEAASWYENSNELKVFIRGLVFSVVVDISDDKKMNREKSIQLANTIIRSKLN